MPSNSPRETVEQAAVTIAALAQKQRSVIGSARANVEQDTDLEYLFMLASVSIHHDLAFLWHCRRALVTFSYTPEGVSLDRLWVPVRYRKTGAGRYALSGFVRFFHVRNIPIYLTVAPLDSHTQPEKLIAFYRSCGFRPTGYINAIKLPEMVCGEPVPVPVASKKHKERKHKAEAA